MHQLHEEVDLLVEQGKKMKPLVAKLKKKLGSKYVVALGPQKWGSQTIVITSKKDKARAWRFGLQLTRHGVDKGKYELALLDSPMKDHGFTDRATDIPDPIEVDVPKDISKVISDMKLGVHGAWGFGSGPAYGRASQSGVDRRAQFIKNRFGDPDTDDFDDKAHRDWQDHSATY